jgi:hypothetical protein
MLKYLGVKPEIYPWRASNGLATKHKRDLRVVG